MLISMNYNIKTGFMKPEDFLSHHSDLDSQRYDV